MTTKRKPEELTDIPGGDINQIVTEFRIGGAASIIVTKQADGRYTILATYKD